ncbi:DUF4921 family protein [Mariniluteicoccus endophyticus]
MADGTVEQPNPFTGSQVWTVPGRGNRPGPRAEGRTPARTRRRPRRLVRPSPQAVGRDRRPRLQKRDEP